MASTWSLYTALNDMHSSYGALLLLGALRTPLCLSQSLCSLLVTLNYLTCQNKWNPT